jgi:hypothetical protein
MLNFFPSLRLSKEYQLFLIFSLCLFSISFLSHLGIIYYLLPVGTLASTALLPLA